MPRASFDGVTAPAAMFSLRTAPRFSCCDPTLRSGSAVTAYVVPPVAAKSAISERTIAGEVWVRPGKATPTHEARGASAAMHPKFCGLRSADRGPGEHALGRGLLREELDRHH